MTNAKKKVNSEWKECTLGEIVIFQRGHDLIETNIKKGNYPVAGSNGIIGYHNEFTTNGPGITLGRSGNSIGVAHFYKDKFWAHNTTLYSKEFHGSDPLFIYYLLKSIDFSAFNTGSAVPSLNRNHISLIKISLPPLPEQRAIAGVLSSLDDKIDLLRRQNKTLEAMAEALFRQWFIEEADEGWEKKPLSGIANFVNGLACQNYPPKNVFDKLPVLKIRELTGGISADSDWATSDIDSDYLVEAGDVIFAWSASLMVKIWDGQRCVLNQHLFKVTSSTFPKWYYYLWCKQHLAEFISISMSHATTMGHIKRGDLDAAMVLVPKESELKQMNKIIEPIFEKQISNAKEIKSLESLRDTLLPKLMSGEVRIPI
jgi:type I restriction enzyme, S subunit